MTAGTLLTLGTAFGLSTAAGLNAYIPLFVVALLSRTTELVTLSEPYDALASWWVIAIVGVLMVVEILVDKIPIADTIDNVINTFIRPAAGAILFAASTNVIGLHPAVAAVCGVVVAGGVHAAKSAARPVVTAATAGTGNPIVSTIEEAISFILSVLAVVAPYLVLAVLVVFASLALWWVVRRRRRR